MNRIVQKFKDQSVLQGHMGVVVGAGKSGVAAARLLDFMGARVRLVDANPAASPDALGDIRDKVDFRTGPHDAAQFSDADIVVLSPGVPLRKLAPFLAEVPERKIVSELELASWFIERPVLAITGTNGKTTTTTLISEILEHAGISTFTGGNIGTPLCEYLLDREPVDVIVLEVSSFQLQTCRLFKPHVGLFLNFTPDHLDYHADMAEYLDAKLNLFRNMVKTDTAILHESLRPVLEGRDFTKAETTWYGPTDRLPAPQLLGDHNRSNVEAAWQAVKCFGVTEAQAAEAVAAFKPLANRLEPVAEVGGVLYVNDSKATTLDSVAVAVASFDRPVRLLMGGVFKGGDVDELARTISDRVVQVGLFGAAREVFEPAFSPLFPTSWDETLELAVKRLAADAALGDVVLLSPATASFDQYQNYARRGDDFRRIVGGLS